MGAMLLLFATMVITIMRRMPARLTATMGRTILTEACSLARGRGSVATTAVAIMADGAATMVAVGMETMRDSAASRDFVEKVEDGVAEANGMVVADSRVTRGPVVAGASMVVASSTVAAMAAGSTVVVDFTEAVDSMAGAAGPTAEVTANRRGGMRS